MNAVIHNSKVDDMSRGGKREGAGRKVTGKAKVPFNCRLPEDVKAWLISHEDSAGVIIERLVKEKRDVKPAKKKTVKRGAKMEVPVHLQPAVEGLIRLETSGLNSDAAEACLIINKGLNYGGIGTHEVINDAIFELEQRAETEKFKNKNWDLGDDLEDQAESLKARKNEV